MANNSPTLRELYAIASKDYFFTCSRINHAFRPSEIFCQILQGYLDQLKRSHSRNRVHNWRTGLMNNIIIRNNDTADIRFAERPVRVDAGEDFNHLRRRDYARLANLIEEMHSGFLLPDISGNSPELMNFLKLLREPLQVVDQIHRHYCLWGFKRRRHLMIDLRYRQDYESFNTMMETEFNAISTINFGTEYPFGFWRQFDNDNFITAIMDGDMAGGDKENRSYANTFRGFVKFIGNMFIHCSPSDDDETYCTSDMEWRLYEEFPFYLHEICQVLLSLRLLFAYE